MDHGLQPHVIANQILITSEYQHGDLRKDLWDEHDGRIRGLFVDFLVYTTTAFYPGLGVCPGV
jgi:hypothetical protein